VSSDGTLIDDNAEPNMNGLTVINWIYRTQDRDQ
jgi:hypothetical protein